MKRSRVIVSLILGIVILAGCGTRTHSQVSAEDQAWAIVDEMEAQGVWMTSADRWVTYDIIRERLDTMHREHQCGQ